MLQNFVDGIVVVKVLAAPFGPKVVENEGTEDVEGLLEVSEAASVVSVKVGGVVLTFDGGLAKQDKRPVNDEVLGNLPSSQTRLNAA